ncbi:MAG: DUF4139 domain-containing protein [Armatimonadetes bacterium]|nr:DUF4139 domain-containing protein [Armatimonadota bacterium]
MRVILLALATMSGAAAFAQSELTVYNQGFALVKEHRSLDLKKGMQKVAVEDVAQMIEANSVGIRSLSHPGSFSVLEQNYQYDLIGVTAILNKAVGKEIVFNRVNPDGKKERIVGTLLSAPSNVVSDANGSQGMVWNGMVVRTNDGRILLNPSGEIEVSSIPEGLISKPTLMWLLDSDLAGKNDVELSYLTQGMTWKSDYVLSLDNAGTKGDLKGWVTLTNNSGTAYNEAKLKLLAGDVFRAENFMGGRGGGGAMRDAMAKAETGMAEEQFAEYHLYTLQRPASIRNNEIKQLSLLEGTDIPVNKKLIVDALRGWNTYYPGEGAVGTGPIKPLVLIEFKNDEASHLGMPMPMGTVKVFQRDKSGALQMLGEASIQHTPKNEKLSLPVGRAFDIVAERKRTDFRWLGSSNRGCVEKFEIEVRNRKETSETVHVYERHWGDWKVTDKSDNFDKLDSETIDFVITLKPNEVHKVTYTIETRW